MWWPFGKKEERISNLEKSMEISFSAVKMDFQLLKEAISHLENKKEEHHTKINILLERLNKLEKDLDLYSVNESESIVLKEPDISKASLNVFENLTDKQKTFCQLLAALNKESPNKWISLKTLAHELHPNSSYNRIRSTLSEYTTLLEELGFLKKKRKGNQAFVMTTSLNPFYEKPKEIKVEMPIRKIRKIRKKRS